MAPKKPSPTNKRGGAQRKTGGKAGGRAGRPSGPVAGTKDKTVRVPASFNAQTVDPTNQRGGNQRPTGGLAGGRAGRPSGNIARPKPKPPASKPPTAKPPQRALPAAGQSGGSKPPKGTTTPQRGGPTRTPAQRAQERRSAASAKKAGASIGQRGSSVNQAVNRAVTQNTVRQAMKAGTGASIVGALLNAPEELKKLQALLRNPKGALSRASSDILSGKAYNPETVKTAKPAKPKPKPAGNTLSYPSGRVTTQAKPTRQGPAVPTRLQQAPEPPKLPAPVRTTAARPSAAPSRTPSRPASRPAASRPSTPKPPSTSSTPKVAGTSGIGPVKSGAEYAKNIKKQPEIGKSFAGSKDMSASEMATSYNTNTNYGSRVNTAFSAESPSTKPSASKKKSSALSQAEIRKRRLNR